MKILFVSHQAEFLYGGEICTLELMRVLKEKHEIFFASPPGPYFDRASQVASRTIEIPSKEFSRKLELLPQLLPALWNTHSALVEFTSKNEVDILHATSLKSMVYSWMVGAKKRVPVLWHHHDILPPTGTNARWAQGIAVGAKRIVVPSKATAEALVQAGVEKDKVKMIRNGFAAERWKKRVSRGPQDKFRVAFAGEIAHRKGADLLLPIIQELEQKAPGRFELMVIGEGLSDPNFAAEVKKGLEPFVKQDIVHLLGHRKDVPELLQLVDALVVPSRQDPLPTVIIEAFFSGVPVLASSAGGIPELVKNGQTGYLCANVGEYSARLKGLLDSTELWQRLSDRSRAAAEENLTSAKMAEAFDALYAEILQEKRPK